MSENSRKEETMTTHTSGAADLPEALRLADALDDGAFVFPNELSAELRRLHALTAGQAVAPAEPTREFLERTLAAMEGVIDVADRKTAEFGALRSCVIDLTLMLFKPSTRPAPPAMDGGEDAALLDFLADECLDLCSFNMPTGQGDADVGWRTVQHHMGKVKERVASEVYRDNPRQAIREAMERIKRDPYCTGPLHIESADRAKDGNHDPR